MRRTVAAIDCGTNSTRLLVARETDSGYETLERLMTITRLGEGVDATGRLADNALGRVVECLQRYREVIDNYDVDSIRMTATSAARDASNSDHFFDLAEVIVGARPELLSGIEEAELSFQGATADLDPLDGPFLVVDIGGGSTEFAYGLDTCTAAISTDMGCVRLTDQYIEHDPARPEELVSCLSIVELNLDDVTLEIPEASSAKTFVGLAGTVSAAAAIEQGLTTYDRDRIHHFDLTKEAVEDVFRTLATEDRAERLENPGMEEGRADVIVGGMCVLVRVMRQFGFEHCLVSEADILDGLVMSQLR
jgi:exopolyphosphatase/guanosine-5'-triphosphate,3'-diphosphate pyrophosphatase